MQTLIIDIETVGESWDMLDTLTQDSLTTWIRRESKTTTEYDQGVEALKESLGFSPLTGSIVAIGVADVQKNKQAVYYIDKAETCATEGNTKYESHTEASMLHQFWEIVQKYDTVVTFNGYAFDIPYLMIRSAVHGIKPSANLMTNRYLSSQRYASIQHVDLQDQLCFYGALRRRGSLHMWCRAFGIVSPKSAEVNGHEVATLYTQGKYKDIARYNAADLIATQELYNRWIQFLKF